MPIHQKCTCANTVRYTDEMVRDVIIRGLYDQDAQRDVLGMQEQDMQLDALIKLLEAKEIGKKTQASILGETGASVSRYKRDKNPAKATCNKCSLTGHFSAVCRKRTPQKWGKADNLGSITNSGYNEKMTPNQKTPRAPQTDPCTPCMKRCAGQVSHNLAGLVPAGLARTAGHQREDYGHRGDGPHHQHRQPWSQ